MKDDLIGTSIKVYGSDKEITITKIKSTLLGNLFLGDDGEWYAEEELEFTYAITPEYLLYDILSKHEIFDLDFNYNIFKEIVKEFMEGMVNAGYIAENGSN